VALEMNGPKGESIAQQGTADLSQWVAAESYWVPSRIVVSAWLEHAPFAAWVMSVVRPSTFVELGTHNGFSFFTFCESADRLGIDTKCFALDTWQGDDHAGYYGDEIYDDVESVRAASHAQRAVLLRGYFSDFVDTFDDGSIDLLHIDGRHGYDDVKEDFESWLPKVSDRGIVLFHDISERERGFGVWQLWDELRERYPSFTFEHGHGLGVLSVGTEIPMRLRPLFGTSDDEAALIREFYHRQGRVVHERWVKDLQIEQRDDEVAVLSARVRELETAHAAARNETLTMAGSYSWRLTRPLRAVAERVPASTRSGLRGGWRRIASALHR
jgi:hypothetical protein